MSSADRKRIGIQLPLGFSSGLPLLLTGATLTAWLQDEHVNLVAIGAFAAVSLPYNFKFLWAPLLDRYTLPLLGRRRGWILLFQLLLAGALAAMGTIDAGASPAAIAVMAVAVAALSASQDVVIDAYRTDLLDAGQRGRGTATYVVGYRVALIVAGAGALALADQVSWRLVYFALAALMAVQVVGTFAAPEPERQHRPASLADAIWKPLGEFFGRRGALVVLSAVALYKFGDSMVSHMVVPFLQQTGFSKTEIGAVQKFAGMAATIAGVGLGGIVLDRIGVLRTLIWFGLLQAVANVGYIVLALHGKSHATLIVAIILDNLCNGLGTAAFVAWLMSLCDERYSATQYALLTSASTILGRLLGAGAGWIVDDIGWAGFFAVTIVVAIPALALILWYRRLVPEPA